MTRKSYGPDLKINEVKSILALRSYREFIKFLISHRAAGHADSSYAALARKAGFSSRSYVREVILGKKRITMLSVEKFIVGLDLVGEWAEFFRLLVEFEHEDCRRRKISSEQIETKLFNYSMRMTSRYKKEPPDDRAFFKEIPIVYAALGPLKSGATLSEISMRTTLPLETIKESLSKLIVLDLAFQKDKKFYACNNHLAIADLQKAENFQKFFFASVARIGQQAKENFSSSEHFFFASCFSVLQSDMALLKEELRSVLQRYIERYEFGQGNKVATLACGLI